MLVENFCVGHHGQEACPLEKNRRQRGHCESDGLPKNASTRDRETRTVPGESHRDRTSFASEESEKEVMFERE